MRSTSGDGHPTGGRYVFSSGRWQTIPNWSSAGRWSFSLDRGRPAPRLRSATVDHPISLSETSLWCFSTSWQKYATSPRRLWVLNRSEISSDCSRSEFALSVNDPCGSKGSFEREYLSTRRASKSRSRLTAVSSPTVGRYRGFSSSVFSKIPNRWKTGSDGLRVDLEIPVSSTSWVTEYFRYSSTIEYLPALGETPCRSFVTSIAHSTSARREGQSNSSAKPHPNCEVGSETAERGSSDTITGTPHAMHRQCVGFPYHQIASLTRISPPNEPKLEAHGAVERGLGSPTAILP